MSLRPLTRACYPAHCLFICKRARIGVDANGMGGGTIRTLIVDDEPIARRTLDQELEMFPGAGVTFI